MSAVCEWEMHEHCDRYGPEEPPKTSKWVNKVLVTVMYVEKM